MIEPDRDIFSYVDEDPPPVKKDGPLGGLRLAVQPSIAVRGWPSDAGSLSLEGYKALEDAYVVRRLRDCGALVRGSTRMCELGFGMVGNTSAAAVTGGHADAVLMIDTMGESRTEAAAAGLVGYKPSYGIVSRSGLTGLIPSMECCSLVAGTLGDAGRVMEVLSCFDCDDYSMPEIQVPVFDRASADGPDAKPLGVLRESLDQMEKKQAEAFRAALAKIESCGLATVEVSLKDFDLVTTVHGIIGSVEASSCTGKYDSVRYGRRAASANSWNEMYIASRREFFGMPLKAYIFQGAYFQYQNYRAFINACRVRGSLIREMGNLFKEVDALIFPTLIPGLRPEGVTSVKKVYDLFAWTVLASLTGRPSVTIPGFVMDDGCDHGLQMVGPHLGDARLLSLAGRLASCVKGSC